MTSTSPAQLKYVFECTLIGGVYIAVSALLITFNKYMMQPEHFPHAIHLTATHMTVTLLMSLSLYTLAPQCYPSMTVAKENIGTVFKYIGPLGCLFAVALLFSNIAYTYSSVAFLQFCKEANVAIVFIMSCVVGTQGFSWTKAGILSVVIGGCTLCVRGELKFVWLGLVVQLASQMAECSKNLIAEIVMSGAGMKLDVLTFVMFQAPCSLAPLMIGVITQWSPQIGQDFIRMWPMLLANALVAFLLNVLIALTLKKLSALAFVIIGVLKDIVIVVSSSFIFGDPISTMQLVGFSVTLTGMVLWSRHKMQEQSQPAKLEKSVEDAEKEALQNKAQTAYASDQSSDAKIAKAV
jgi:drug/metabolite transporter (DMT)-like permease